MSLEFLTSISEKAFKQLVKMKIKSHEFSSLIQETKSKTRNLIYTHLEMQHYLHLEKMSKNEAIILFKFRTRMAPFGENFKGEHWWRTIIGGVKIWGKINRFALNFFSNFTLYKRYQPLKFKIFNFLSS